MSTSSQYRSAAHSPSHYHHLPSPGSQHRALYAALPVSATWPPDPNHDSYAGPSPAQYLHYSHPGDGSANVLPSSAAPPWSAGDVRPQLHAWPQPYHYQHQHQHQQPQQQHPDQQQPQQPQQPQKHQHQHQPTLPNVLPHNDAEPFNPPRVSSVSLFVPIAPAFTQHSSDMSWQPPTAAANLVFPSHAPQEQAGPMHPACPPLVTPQAPSSWDTQLPYPDHSSSAYTSLVTSCDPHSSSITAWPMVTSDQNLANPRLYDRLHHVGDEWQVLQGQPDYRPYSQHNSTSAPPFDNGATQLVAQQRSLTKKKAAKVPSSFVERQEKLKVSKRKGPLHEKQREKTHTMRKVKKICIRCRFYKSGVRTRPSHRVLPWLTSVV